MIIESESNSKLKLIRKLDKKKYRHKEGLYLIEGVRLIEQAISMNADIEFLLFSTKIFDVNGGRKLVKTIYSQGINYAQVEDRLFESLSNTVNSQGIIGVVNMQSLAKKSVAEKMSSKTLLIDRIQDPGNLGTIIRTADAAGFKDLFIARGTVDPYNSKTIRATMGSILNVNIHFVKETDVLIDQLKKDKYQLIATAMSSEKTYSAAAYSDRVVLIIGNEANGIDQELIEQADLKVSIPIQGAAESLNAAIAAGIVMYKINESID